MGVGAQKQQMDDPEESVHPQSSENYLFTTADTVHHNYSFALKQEGNQSSSLTAPGVHWSCFCSISAQGLEPCGVDQAAG